MLKTSGRQPAFSRSGPNTGQLGFSRSNVCVLSKLKNNTPLFSLHKNKNQHDSCEQIWLWQGSELRGLNSSFWATSCVMQCFAVKGCSFYFAVHQFSWRFKMITFHNGDSVTHRTDFIAGIISTLKKKRRKRKGGLLWVEHNHDDNTQSFIKPWLAHFCVATLNSRPQNYKLKVEFDC